jgi:hypothetical protein
VTDHGDPEANRSIATFLAEPSVWVEPRAGLEDAVVAAVARAGSSPVAHRDLAPPRPRTRPRLAAVAAALLTVVLVGAGLVLSDSGGPDYSGQLAATELAVGARASVAVTQSEGGCRMVLRAHGLPRLTDDEFYQAWLRADDGTLVPVGSFVAGDGPITLWSGVSPDDYPGFTVTIEPTDNDQASSGRRVLVGELQPT